jgi:DNA-binding FadR family transcriptional regulator
MNDINAADRIEHALRLAILRGVHPPGSRIPAVRALAAAHGVNAATIQRALARLEATGLVVARPGRGTIVQDPARHGDLTLLPAWLEALTDADAAAAVLGDFLKLRRTIFARLLAEHCGPVSDATDELQTLARAAFDTNAPLHAIQAADFALAHALFAATGDRVARAILVTTERLLHASPDVAEAMYAEPAANLDAMTRIFGLLASGADDRATEAGVEGILARLDAETLRRFSDGRRGR